MERLLGCERGISALTTCKLAFSAPYLRGFTPPPTTISSTQNDVYFRISTDSFVGDCERYCANRENDLGWGNVMLITYASPMRISRHKGCSP
jgi:hypothetical protein